MVKTRIFMIPALLLAVLILCAGLLGIPAYRDRYVPEVDAAAQAEITRLDLSGKPIGSIGALRQHSRLEWLDLRGSGVTVAQYKTLRRWFPDCEILWDIPFQGRYYPMNTQELTIDTLSQRDLALLDYFPELKRIQARNCTDYEMLSSLRSARPELDVIYGISLGGRTFSREVTQLTVPAQWAAELSRVIPWFENLESVTLTDCWGEMEAVQSLREAFPDLSITWRFSFRGLALEESTEKLDLTGIPMTVEETEALLAHLPCLTYVDMTDCGISNEEMEEMNLRHEDVKIVWTVKLGGWFRIRTDATWFMPVKYDYYPEGNELENLKYCHDIIALDIGHMDIYSCEFVAYMPKLKYLLMADTKISDLTPLTGLQELVYLELFLTHVTDCTPLLTITTLEDLNLCYTVGDPVTISQMTWLKNLWWTNCWGQYILTQTLTETHLEFASPSSTGNGWRELPNYYAQRDIFGMRYMKG